jgi:hypothetical protein
MGVSSSVKVGEVDGLGRKLWVVAGKYIFKRSKQDHCVAVCYETGCGWRRDGRNAMGTGSRHAAAKAHLVVVTREMVTEFDGKTPAQYPGGRP